MENNNIYYLKSVQYYYHYEENYISQLSQVKYEC